MLDKRPRDEHWPFPVLSMALARNAEPQQIVLNGDGSGSSEAPPRVPALVNGRYEIKSKVGSGSYSEVYLGVDKISGDKVAAKFEWTKAEKGQRLLQEAQFYESLAGTDDAPRIRWSGSQSEYNILVMDLLGPSLEDLFISCGKRFSLKTVVMLAEQMIDRIEYVHSRGILHRDIKPNNFLMGVGDRSHRVYVMDFGLAKRYIDPATGEHIPCNKKKGLTGTVRYTSLNVHDGLEPSRRDDLGAIGYVLMYFNRGRLPWQGINAKSKRTKQRKIGGRKEQTSHEELCKGYPHEFVKYLQHCDSVAYDDPPDYAYLRRLMRDVFVRECFPHDLRFDWMLAEGTPKPVEGKEERKRVRSFDDRRANTGGAEKHRSEKRRREEGEKDEYDYDYDSDEYGEEEESEYEYEYEEEESEEEEKEHDREVEQCEGGGKLG